jgi:hypothetical protein
MLLGATLTNMHGLLQAYGKFVIGGHWIMAILCQILCRVSKGTLWQKPSETDPTVGKLRCL